MLNKEDILALAWEYSEGSGKRYTFTEESLLEMVWIALSRQNSNEVASTAQDERKAFEVACMAAGLVRPGNYCTDFDRYVSERVQGRYEGFKLFRATRPAQTAQGSK